MCGICGIVDLTGSGRANQEIVEKQCNQIIHRGPDGHGIYTTDNMSFGMRRLSIIDVDGSEQPLFNHDRTIALVFNGEIYNYKELRQKLIELGYTFQTDGDGETLIYLYQEYELGMFTHLRGMYAFALWDEHKEELLIAIDHIGMKPLYLAERDGLLQFASEVKALQIDYELNLDALDTYLSFGFQVGQDTLFKGVQRLMPGHYCVIKNGQIREGEHWSFTAQETYPEYANFTEKEAIEEAKRLLRDSVDIHLRSDVPLGLFLSGGIDSATILGLMSEYDTQSIKTFTIGYDADVPDNELHHARKIATYFKTDHHERIINAQDWWHGFENYVYHEDEPTANPSAVSLMLLAEDTAKSVKVVLTGLGGDELFCGYPHHRNIPALLQRQQQWGAMVRPFEPILGAMEHYYPMFKRYRIIGAIPTYAPELRRVGMSRNDGLMRAYSFDGMVFSDVLRSRLYGNELKQRIHIKQSIYDEVIELSNANDTHKMAQAMVINTWLHGNALLHADKVTMAHSLEARIPLFDPKLLNFASQLPSNIQMKQNKHVMREAMRDVLPDFALSRPKQPFSTPIRGWFARELQPQIREKLMNQNHSILDLFDKKILNTILTNHFEGREKQEEVVFRLLTLVMWAERFGVN